MGGDPGSPRSVGGAEGAEPEKPPLLVYTAARGPLDQRVPVARPWASEPEGREVPGPRGGELTGGWIFEKTVSALAVAPVLGVLCLAFWRRSPLWGLLVIDAIAVGKMAWGVVDGAGTGWAMLGSALAVLVV